MDTAETHCIQEKNIFLDEKNCLSFNWRKFSRYNLFLTIPLRQLVFSVGDINRSRVTHPRVSMPMSVEKPNKLR